MYQHYLYSRLPSKLKWIFVFSSSLLSSGKIDYFRKREIDWQASNGQLFETWQLSRVSSRFDKKLQLLAIPNITLGAHRLPKIIFSLTLKTSKLLLLFGLRMILDFFCVAWPTFMIIHHLDFSVFPKNVKLK